MKKALSKLGAAVVILSAITMFATPALSNDFMADVARVDDAIRKNPSRVLPQAVESCLKQRNFAVQLYRMGETVRAQRSLEYCFRTLAIPEKAVERKVTAPSQEALQAKAAKEYERALALKPDVANGLKIYRECAACHEPEGWGLPGGGVPQIAGQHRKVVIMQLADFRAGNRASAMMAPYASAESIGGAQGIADVAAYIDTLEMSVANGKGRGDKLELGGRLYGERCADCHGASGEGDNDALTPRLQAQHYNYLQRQFKRIRDGKRHNANPDMEAQIQTLESEDVDAILDYVSRLEPPEMMQAPPDWKNPDFN